MSERPNRLARDVLVAAVFSVLATWIGYLAVARPLTGIDDANIFFAYASNVAEGHGFVYNAEGERVEGFTSFLWLLICSGVFAVSDRPELTLLVVNVLLLTATMTMLTQFVRRLNDDAAELTDLPSDVGAGPSASSDWILLLVGGWLLLNPKFVIWTTITLMDVGLWSAIFTGGTLLFASSAGGMGNRRHPWLLSLAVVLMLLVRPEGMLLALLWPVAAVTGRVLYRDRGTSPLEAARDAWTDFRLPVLSYVLTLSGLFVFRLAYFGYPFPNTYYAKVSGDLFYNLRLGLGYLKGYLLSQPVAIVSLLGIAAAALRALIALTRLGSRARPVVDPADDQPGRVGDLRRQFALCFLAGAGICVPVLTGGDHFDLYRFYQPFWPLLLLPLWSAIRAWLHRSTRRGMTVAWALSIVAAGVLYFVQFPRYEQVDSRVRVEYDYARSGRRIGQALNRCFSGGARPSIGVTAAGGIAYAYQGTVVDLMGLNNVRMGHSPGDRRGNKNHAAFDEEVFYELSPDLVLPGLVLSGQRLPDDARDLLPDPGSFWDTATDGIFRTIRFRQQYQPVLIWLNSLPEEELAIKGWCKSTVLKQWRDTGRRVKVLAE